MVIGADIYCGIYCQYRCDPGPGPGELVPAWCEHLMSRPCYFLRSKVGPERERGMLGIGGAHNTLTSDTRGGGLMSDLSRLCNNHKHRTSVQPSRVLMQFVITGW